MKLDVTKLPPFPWKWGGHSWRSLESADGKSLLWYTTDDDGIHAEPGVQEFIELASAAFDVMMRRGWGLVLAPGGWEVTAPHQGTFFRFQRVFADPFTGLVEADKWYKEHVESTGDPCKSA